MSKQLYLITFTQSVVAADKPAHWGLYLADPKETTGTVYHVSKDQPMGGMTRYSSHSATPTRSKDIRQATLIVNVSFDEEYKYNVCGEVSKDRKFNLVVNNCQRWCAQILAELVRYGQITQAEDDGLKAKGFEPLV